MTKTTNCRGAVLYRGLLATASIAALATPTIAAAQSSGGLDEIVVTAEFKDENLQTVPLAITAVTGDTIDKSGIVDLQGVAQRVPGLTFSPFSPGQNIVSLRGVSSNDDGAGTDNSVAIFVDGVYSGRVSNVNPEIFDLEAVEVLRGPQGTLRGKNTIGGAILYRTRKPNHDEFEALLRATYGNFEHKEIGGFLTGPLGGGWAAKGSFNIRVRDGWVFNRVLQKHQKDDDAQSFRGQLSYDGDKVDALFSADYNKLDVEDMARIPLTNNHGLAGNVDAYEAVCGVDFSPRCSANPSDGFANRKGYGGSAQFDIDIGFGQLTSISAYRENRGEWEMDSIGALFPLTDRIVDATNQFTQELRLDGAAGEIDYVFGLWYSNEKTDRTEIFDFLSDRNFAGSDRYRQINTTNSYAVFGQADWGFAPNWELSVGARYSIDKKDIDNFADAGDFVIINQTFQNTRSKTFDGFTPRVVLSYQLGDRSNAYASFSQGFKSGGFAAAPTNIASTDPLRPEKATNFEIGYKADLADNTIRFNAAAFYTRLKDLQYQSFGPLPGNSFGEFRTSNLERARSFGVETELTWAPTDQFTFSAVYGYLNAKYVEAQIFNSNSSNQNGLDLVRAPRHKISLDASYVIPTSVGDFEASANWRLTGQQRGEVDYDVINGERVPYAFQPAFNLFDARLSWTSKGENVEVAGWVRNAFDQDWVSHIYTIGGDVIGVFGDPRTYGVTLTLRL